MVTLVVMEKLLQPETCVITQICERILRSNLAQVLFGIKHTDLAGCYGNAVTMAIMELYNTQQIYMVVTETLLLETRGSLSYLIFMRTWS